MTHNGNNLHTQTKERSIYSFCYNGADNHGRKNEAEKHRIIDQEIRDNSKSQEYMPAQGRNDATSTTINITPNCHLQVPLIHKEDRTGSQALTRRWEGRPGL